MPRRWSGTLALLCTFAPALGPATPLSAQDHDDGPMRVYSFTAGRPRIGVTVDMRAGRDNDRLGATVKDVTDDGPADKAGLKAGDIITRFNGVSLAGTSGDGEEGPGARLVELAGKLEPGDTVDVEYRRGGDSRKAKVVAADLGGPSLARGFRFEMPDMNEMRPGPGEMPRMMLDRAPGDVRFFVRRDDGMELAELSPELGEYFGTKEGILVLKADADGSDLRAGDVILSIDGRVPTSEAHARRILGSYDSGETAKLEIMRKQKKQTLSWKAPERERDLQWKTPVPATRGRVRVERS